jgi:hypothetical protein
MGLSLAIFFGVRSRGSEPSLSRPASALQEDQSQAILPSTRGGPPIWEMSAAETSLLPFRKRNLYCHPLKEG